MMVSNKTKILSILLFFLVSIYILSFIISHINNAIEYKETSFINPKYREDIQKIILTDIKNNSYIKLLKRDKSWILKSSEDSESYSFLADEEVINKFIPSLLNIRKLYKKVYNNEYKSNQELRFCLNVFSEDDSEILNLYIGNNDFSKENRFVYIPNSSENKLDSYSTTADFEHFLHTQVQYWYEPNLIPRSFENDSYDRLSLIKDNHRYVLSQTDFELKDSQRKIFKLRHGLPFYGDKILLVKDSDLELVIGSVQKEKIEIYKNVDDGYVFHYELGDLYNYFTEVSFWTYKELIKEFGLK